MRVISLVVACFLFFSTLESWAGFWLAGRWFVSSRYASLTLSVVKSWLDRGIISSSTQTAKVFINRHGKIILMTLALSEVISEVQQRLQASQYCYDPNPVTDKMYMHYLYVPSYSRVVAYSRAYSPYTDFYFLTSSCSTTTIYGSDPFYLTTYRIYKRNNGNWERYLELAKPGTYTITTRDGITCTAEFSWKIPIPPCLSEDGEAWQNERRRIPVRVYPNPADFLRPDVIESDPALRYLRDEYNRIAQDTSIPTIPSDALSEVSLPEVDWTIPPEEALDGDAESSEVSQSGSQSGSHEGSQDASLSVPGFDTSLSLPERRSFPVELVNSLVQSHPLLRVLQRVNLDVSGVGSCVVGSRPFEFDFCQFGWVLNLMGGLIVYIAFLTGLFWAGRSD